MNDSKIKQLKDLQELYSSNVNSQEEFSEMKKNILDGAGSDRVASVSQKSHKIRNIILIIVTLLFVIGGTCTAYMVKINHDKEVAQKSKVTESIKKKIEAKKASQKNKQKSNKSSSSEKNESSETSVQTTKTQAASIQTGPMTEADAIALIGKAGIGTADAQLMPTGTGTFDFAKHQSNGQMVVVEPDNMNNWTEAYVTLKDGDGNVISDQHFSRN